MCIAQAFQQEMKLQSPAFLVILRAVKSEGKDGQSGENTSTEVDKIKREDFPNNIWRVCKEFKVVFPKDLPKGGPPRCMGHEFKIDLEPDIAPITDPSTSSVCSSCKERRHKLIQCLSMALFASLNTHGVPWLYLCQRKMAAFSSVSITIGWIGKLSGISINYRYLKR